MKRLRVGSVLVIAILFGGFAYTQWHQRTAPLTAEAPRTFEVTLAIAGVLPAHRIAIAEGTTALEALRMESAHEGFVMSEKEYAGLGTLVEQIGDFRNGDDDRYWTYTVNGGFSPVGADRYEPKEGDYIEWTFDMPDGTSY